MNLTTLIQKSREMATTPCATHPSETETTAIDCSACCADAKVNPDPDVRRVHSALRAMAACDRRYPTRRRNAFCDHPEVAKWCSAASTDLPSAPSLLLSGLVGVGKTHQAYGALRRIIANNPTVEWEASAFAEFTASLRPGGSGDIERYKTVGLLLLDDLGAGKGSEWVEEVSYRVVDARYEAMLPTIYITNCGTDELAGSLGDRILSRIAGSCTHVFIDGDDRRRCGQ
jgi:DNA replication protein DnaC